MRLSHTRKNTSKYNATFALMLFWLGFCSLSWAEPAPRASEWFADDDEGTQIVQIGARQATRDAYFLLAGLAGVAGLVIAGLVWQLRRREHAMLNRLRETEARLQEAQAIASVGSWTRDFATGETYWSPEARALLMLDEEQKKWGHYETFVHPDDLDLVIEAIARAYCRGGIYRCDHRLVCPNGVIKHVRLVGRVYLRRRAGEAVFEHGTVQDITERKLIEMHLRENEEKLRDILEATPLATMIFALEENHQENQEDVSEKPLTEECGTVRYVNPATCTLLGLPVNADLSSVLFSSHWVSQEALDQFTSHLVLADKVVQCEALLRKTDGALFWGALQARVTRYGGERVALVCIQDVSEQHAYLEELETRATRDPITGVLNSHSMQEVANKEFRRALRYNQPVSLCVISLDQLRSVSEGFGHVVAEQLIRQFVDLLKDGVRVEDSLGRLSQEEFVLLLVGATLEGGKLVAERLRKMCEDEYFELQRQPIRLTVSAGVASLDTPEEQVEDVMMRAQDALQQARRMGANCVATRRQVVPDYQKKA